MSRENKPRLKHTADRPIHVSILLLQAQLLAPRRDMQWQTVPHTRGKCCVCLDVSE